MAGWITRAAVQAARASGARARLDGMVRTAVEHAANQSRALLDDTVRAQVDADRARAMKRAEEQGYRVYTSVADMERVEGALPPALREYAGQCLTASGFVAVGGVVRAGLFGATPTGSA